MVVSGMRVKHGVVLSHVQWTYTCENCQGRRVFQSKKNLVLILVLRQILSVSGINPSIMCLGQPCTVLYWHQCYIWQNYILFRGRIAANGMRPFKHRYLVFHERVTGMVKSVSVFDYLTASCRFRDPKALHCIVEGNSTVCIDHLFDYVFNLIERVKHRVHT